MKYQIVTFEPDRSIVVVQVGTDEANMADTMKLPISLRNIYTLDQFEKQVYTTYAATWEARDLHLNARVWDNALENHLTTNNGGTPLDFTIPIVPVGVAQSSSSDAPTDETTNTQVEVI